MMTSPNLANALPGVPTVPASAHVPEAPTAAPAEPWAVLTGPWPAGVKLLISALMVAAVAFAVEAMTVRGSWLHAFFYERSWVQWLILLTFTYGVVELALRVPVYLRERRALARWREQGQPGPDGGLVTERYQQTHRILRCGPLADFQQAAKHLAEQAAAQLESAYASVSTLIHLSSYLGFFGTVTGLSFGLYQTFMTQANASPRAFAAALATAFDTTIAGLASTILLIMLQSLIRKREETLLTEVDQLSDSRFLEEDQALAAVVTGEGRSPLGYRELAASFSQAYSALAAQTQQVVAAAQAGIAQTQAVLEAVAASKAAISAELTSTLRGLAAATEGHTAALNALQADMADQARQLADESSRAAASLQARLHDELHTLAGEVRDQLARPRRIQVIEVP